MIPLPTLRAPPLLQFRAGTAQLANGTVTASAKKGYLSILRRNEASVELVWSGEGGERVTAVLPKGKTTVQYTEKCTTGRVLVLTVREAHDATRTLFFWLQDKSTSKDAEHLARLQELLTPRDAAARAGGGGSAAASGSGGGGMVRLEDVKRMLADITASASGEQVELVDVLASSKLTDALREHADFFATRLRPHLPADTPADADLVLEVKCPQATNAARVLQAALRDPATFRSLCREFALDAPSGDAQASSGVAAFLKRITDKAKRDAPPQE